MNSSPRLFKNLLTSTKALHPTWNFPDRVIKKALLLMFNDDEDSTGNVFWVMGYILQVHRIFLHAAYFGRIRNVLQMKSNRTRETTGPQPMPYD